MLLIHDRHAYADVLAGAASFDVTKLDFLLFV